MKSTLISLAMVWGLPFIVLCQQYPFLIRVDVDATVSQNPVSEIFTYTFAMSNDLHNVGSIQDFQLDISRPANSFLFDTNSLRFCSKLEEDYFRRRYNESYIPVGFTGVPGKEWTAMLTNKLTVSIFANSNFVKPGGSVGGIVLTSKGLPGFRTFGVEPDFQDDLLFPSIEDTSANAMTTVQMDSIRSAVNYHGWTIGPTSPPKNFDPSVWVDTLLSYTHQSVDLGWLGKSRDDDCDNDEHPQDGIEKNIERRLTVAQRGLQNGDSVKAHRDLRMLLNKVERIWKRSQEEEKKQSKGKGRGEKIEGRRDDGRRMNVTMTSEAYALLKYNIEYLIDRLPERERHEGRDKKPQ